MTTEVTTQMFPKGDDLPLFAGKTYGPQEAQEFTPTETAHQESMFDLRPQLGATEPTYAPKKTGE